MLFRSGRLVGELFRFSSLPSPPTPMSLRRLFGPIITRFSNLTSMPVSTHSLSPPGSPAPAAKRQKLDEPSTSSAAAPPPTEAANEQPVASTSALPKNTKPRTTLDYRNKAVLAPMVRSGNLPNVSELGFGFGRAHIPFLLRADTPLSSPSVSFRSSMEQTSFGDQR